MTNQILALAGGVGGAKLSLGLYKILSPNQLTIVVNTGDDEEFHGLNVSPDLDTIMYTLAGIYDNTNGWGLQNETFNTLKMLKTYGVDTWFNLGDKDLATHIERTRLIRSGWTLSQVTRQLCKRLGVHPVVVPMSDNSVRTIAKTNKGNLTFQEYFVKYQCKPIIKGLEFKGAKQAKISPGFIEGLTKANAIIFCPSNPLLSLAPILSLTGVRKLLENFNGLRLAVSPIVAGKAIKGPAAKIFAELGMKVSCVEVANFLKDICDILVIDNSDAHLAGEINAIGIKAVVTNTIMNSDEDKKQLAKYLLALLDNGGMD